MKRLFFVISVITLAATSAFAGKFYNLQASGGWIGYGELPPQYNICTSCKGVSWWMRQGVKNPWLDGKAAQFNIGGSVPYADVLWTNHLIGQGSSQGMPDPYHKIVPYVHNFVYDAYFYGSNLQLSQALEFDVNQYFNSMSFIWGTQCRVAGGNEWDIWDNLKSRWVPTGIPCYPKNNAWNHVTIQVDREPDNWLRYTSITLNGVTKYLNWHYTHGYAPSGWYGITANYQTDGNYRQSPYSTFLDQFTFAYW